MILDQTQIPEDDLEVTFVPFWSRAVRISLQELDGDRASSNSITFPWATTSPFVAKWAWIFEIHDRSVHSCFATSHFYTNY